MAKVKISEFNSNPALNTDIDSINLAEGCAPSGINDAIRELMSQLKDWQSGTSNDPYVVGSSGSLTLNQGTANTVPYLNGSKVVTSGTALSFDGTRLFTNSTAVPTGVTGTGVSIWNKQSNTSLNAINTVASASDAFAYIGHNGSVGAIGVSYGNTAGYTPLAFYTNDSERMRLDSSGNLGLGVTPSAWGSSYKALQTTAGSFSSISATDLRIYQNGYDDGGGSKYVSTNAASLYRQSGASHIWYNAASGTAGNAITFTQAMTLDASGNLGVGTTSPSARVHVVGGSAGNLNAPAVYIQNNRFLTFQNSAGSAWGMGIYADSSDNGWIGAVNNLTFNTGSGATERARIDSSGNLLVGTTSALGTAARLAILFDEQAAIGATLRSSNATTGGSFMYFQNSAGANAGSISHTGSTSVAYNTSSDYRLKEITGPVTGAKQFIMALQPKQGTWKADGSKFVGFLAHEFQEVSPTSVSGTKDAVDANGNPVYQSMQASTSEVMANLISLVQEQQAIIESLTTRITALEGQ